MLDCISLKKSFSDFFSKVFLFLNFILICPNVSVINICKTETVYTGLVKSTKPVASTYEPTSKPLYESIHQMSKSYESTDNEDSAFDPEKFLADNYAKPYQINPMHASHNISHNIHNHNSHDFGVHLGGK